MILFQEAVLIRSVYLIFCLEYEPLWLLTILRVWPLLRQSCTLHLVDTLVLAMVHSTKLHPNVML